MAVKHRIKHTDAEVRAWSDSIERVIVSVANDEPCAHVFRLHAEQLRVDPMMITHPYVHAMAQRVRWELEVLSRGRV